MASLPAPPPFVQAGQAPDQGQSHLQEAAASSSAAPVDALISTSSSPLSSIGELQAQPQPQPEEAQVANAQTAFTATTACHPTAQPNALASSHIFMHTRNGSPQDDSSSSATHHSSTTQSQQLAFYAPLYAPQQQASSTASSAVSSASQALSRWSPAEDVVLLASVKQRAPGSWRPVAADICEAGKGPHRSAAAAKARYLRLKEYWTSPAAPAVPGTSSSSVSSGAATATHPTYAIPGASASTSYALVAPHTSAASSPLSSAPGDPSYSHHYREHHQQDSSNQQTSLPTAPFPFTQRPQPKPWTQEEETTLAAVGPTCAKQRDVYSAYCNAMPGTTRTEAAVVKKWRQLLAKTKKAEAAGGGGGSTSGGAQASVATGEGTEQASAAQKGGQGATAMAAQHQDEVGLAPAGIAAGHSTMQGGFQAWPGAGQAVLPHYSSDVTATAPLEEPPQHATAAPADLQLNG